ncbi:acyl-CoA N-acyltransferase [Leucogyrophana mollusca]|uniref:Acyl-CoA N-acyltransferase n=1 Tax=Leucogyrophana mollusca TaxID=85980 RepID=A0ACB8BS71_9AGAM|nr:acyl-CoA N-acyltransferase [Leucogyrophana mollusca]
MFTTDRLLLRGFKDKDLDDLLAMRNDPRVQRGATLEPIVPSPEAYKETLKGLAERSTIWFTVVLKESGEFMGQCSIKVTEPQKNRDALFAISLMPMFWGNGYGTEATTFTVGYAFKALGIQRVSLTVLEGNAGALSLYKKVGFKVEGRKRRANWVEGNWEDSISMGVLDEEWAAIHRKSETSKVDFCVC